MDHLMDAVLGSWHGNLPSNAFTHFPLITEPLRTEIVKVGRTENAFFAELSDTILTPLPLTAILCYFYISILGFHIVYKKKVSNKTNK